MKRLYNLAQRRFALVGDLGVCSAIIADTTIIKGNKRHGFRKNTFCAPAKCVLPCRIMRIFTRNNLDPLNSFNVKRRPAASDLLGSLIGVILWKNPLQLNDAAYDATFRIECSRPRRVGINQTEIQSSNTLNVNEASSSRLDFFDTGPFRQFRDVL